MKHQLQRPNRLAWFLAAAAVGILSLVGVGWIELEPAIVVPCFFLLIAPALATSGVHFRFLTFSFGEAPLSLSSKNRTKK